MEDPGGFLDNSAGFDAPTTGGEIYLIFPTWKNMNVKFEFWFKMEPTNVTPSKWRAATKSHIVWIRFWGIWGRRGGWHCEQLEDKTSRRHIFPLALPYTGNYR